MTQRDSHLTETITPEFDQHVGLYGALSAASLPSYACRNKESKMANHTCPICGTGQLHLHSEPIAVEHLGQQGTIESRYAVCDACGSEQAGAAEARFNKRAIVAFKKRVQGLLTGDKKQSTTGQPSDGGH